MLSTATVILAAVVGSTGSCEIWEFTADYCPGCRQMEPAIQQAKAAGLPIRQFHLDREPGPAAQLGITKIPAIVIVVDGQPVSKKVGPATYEQLVQLYRQFAPDDQSASGNTAPTAPRSGEAYAAGLNRERGPPPRPDRFVGHHPRDVQQQATAATVRLKIEDAEGHSFGTGTVIDAHDDEVLVLTCGHIFRDSNGKGRILCDFFTPAAGRGVVGKLISYDLRRDIGLVSVRPLVPVQPMTVGGNGQRSEVASKVFSVGCNHGEDPTIISNQVIAVNRYHGPANLVVGGRPVDGRSGGGLFDASGVLIGVCNAADQEEDEGLYAALGPIHSELDRAGLAFVYSGQLPAVATRTNPPASFDRPTGPLVPTAAPVSATMPMTPSQPVSDLVPPPGDPRSSGSGGRTAAVDPEVICIVRSSDQSGKSQVYVIDKPSQTLVGELSKELSRRGPHQPTNLRVPGADRHGAPAPLDGDAGWQTMSDRHDVRPLRR